MQPRSPSLRFAPLSNYAITAVAALLLAHIVVAQFPQPESPVNVIEGIVTPISYGQHTTSLTASGWPEISFLGDVDVYRFYYTQGDTVRVIVHAFACIDPTVTAYSQTFVQVPLSGATNCNGNNPYGCNACAFSATFGGGPTPPASGYYDLYVSDLGSDETGVYVLNLERVPSSTPASLPYNLIVTDTLSPNSDVDFVSFPAAANSWVRITATSGGCIDPTIEVVDPTGTIVATSWCNGNNPYGCNTCSFTVDVGGPLPNPPILAGTYSVLIRDAGHDESGTYTISVQCLGGQCPTAPAPYTLSVIQPTGAGSVQMSLTNGPPNGLYVNVLSTLAANAPVPHLGWLYGLHIDFNSELMPEVSTGVPPFVGLLDGAGSAIFSRTTLPIGAYPPIYALSIAFDPSGQHVLATTGVITINLL